MTEEERAKIREAIKKAEESLKVLEKDIIDARRAGIDVAELEKRYRDLQRRISMLKAVYG